MMLVGKKSLLRKAGKIGVSGKVERGESKVRGVCACAHIRAFFCGRDQNLMSNANARSRKSAYGWTLRLAKHYSQLSRREAPSPSTTQVGDSKQDESSI